MVHFERKQRLRGVKSFFGPTAHCEPARSEAAAAYVHKDDTAVVGTRFELGRKPFNRGIPTDWDTVFESAKSGDFSAIPNDVKIRCYNQLKQIKKDYLVPVPIVRTCMVYWGATGTGKSRRAWEEAGMDAYPKDPCTKFWDGYQEHLHVVIDEFRGAIGISHMLRWLDRYPVIVEQKHGAGVLRAVRVWITSNVDPREWYPEADQSTRDALLRRLDITHFNGDL